MPQHLPPPDPGDPGDLGDDPGRSVYIRLDPTLDEHGSPLRRALRWAGLRGPFGLGTPPSNSSNSTDSDDDDQETPNP